MLAQLEREIGSAISHLNANRSPESPDATTPNCHPAFQSGLIRVSHSSRERSPIAVIGNATWKHWAGEAAPHLFCGHVVPVCAIRCQRMPPLRQRSPYEWYG